MPLSNNISNIIGTRIPQWITKQINTRAAQGSQNSRDNENLKYLSNKTSWVRTVSSVNLKRDSQDFKYFKEIDPQIQNPDDLAKRYVLFAGTSKYNGISQTSVPQYELRSGFGVDGSYGMMGKKEVQDFGYRPMMGITSVTIETQGRLGSVRQATVEFKCWTKNQLDITDSLYFKLGYTMFLEWGHTYYYDSEKQTVESSEQWSIDPFTPISNNEFSKEDIYRKININSRKSCGNYDAMLGIVTNYNFSYNQDGGFDCMIRLTSLGYLGDSIKINNPSPIVSILKDEIVEYKKTIDVLSITDASEDSSKNESLEEDNRLSVDQLIEKYKKTVRTNQDIDFFYGSEVKFPLGASKADYFLLTPAYGEIVTVRKLGGFIPTSDSYYNKTRIVLSYNKLLLESLGNNDSVYAYYSNNNNGIIQNPSFIATLKAAYENYRDNASITNKITTAIAGGLTFGTAAVANILYEAIKNEEVVQSKVPFTVDVTYDPIKYPYKNDKNGKDRFEVDLTRKFFAQIESLTDGDYTIDSKSDEYIAVRNETFGKALLEYFSKKPELEIVEIKKGLPLEGEFAPTVRIKLKLNNFVIYSDSPDGLYPVAFSRQVIQNGEIKKEFKEVRSSYILPVTIEITDLDLIESFYVDGVDQPLDYYKKEQEEQLRIQNEIEKEKLENQKRDLEVLKTQILESINTQSSLELILRTIQVRTLNRAIFKDPNKPDLDIGNTVYKFQFDKKFRDQIFSNGIYTDIIQDLVDEKSRDIANDKDKIFYYAKYGFATSLLGSEEDLLTSINDLGGKEVDYEELLTSYAVPYKINQELVNGIQTNHPVYIPFGLLLMIVNQVGGIFDTKKGDNQTNDKKGNFQKPLVYLDYNPKLNFFLTNEQHLSTDPFSVLIPIEGSQGSYSKLFNEAILNKDRTQIRGVENSQIYPLFKDDRLSSRLPSIKDEIAYRGKTMNILISIDHVLSIIRSNSTSDERNSVYLKPFVEEILTSINKSLGDFNLFRLAYNDKANTFHVVDDQLVPGLPDDVLLSEENRTEIPIVGLGSVAKNLELRTQISSRLGNMIAISANSSPQDQVQSSTNGDTFGFFNLNFEDRYIPRRTEGQSTKPTSLNGEIISAVQFNKTIEDFYSSVYASPTDVAQATSYYIEKMARVKNENSASRSSALIPVGINLTLEGMGGLRMGQAFTVTDNLLPYSFNKAEFPVGFVIMGLKHTIQNNIWDTYLTTHILPIKNRTVFNLAAEQARVNNQSFKSDFYNPNGYSAKTTVVPNASSLRVVLNKLGYSEKNGEISSWGDISNTLSNAAQKLFTFIKNDSDTSRIAITITGGNDVYHQTKVTYKSKHTEGNGLDFTISPNDDESVERVSNAITRFIFDNPGLLGFDNEYKKQSEQATGKHFHIFVS